MFEAVTSLIEEKGETLASEWLAELERRGNVLAATRNRRQLWNDAKTWVTLLLRAMRTNDIAPLQRASRLTARRLAVGGFPAADAVEAILAFKAVLSRAVLGAPRTARSALAEMGVVSEWFDRLAIGMVEDYGARLQGDGSRSVVVARAKQLSRLAEQETAISHLAQEMAAERDTGRLLDLIARSAAHIAGAQKAAVMVGEGESVRYEVAYHLPLAALNDYARRVHEPLSGALALDEASHIVADLGDLPDGARAAARKLGVHTALRVPMRVGGRNIALLELFDPLAGQAWTHRDVDLVRELSAQGGLAVENARLLAATERRAAELNELNEIGRAFAAQLNSARLHTMATEGAARLLRAPSALLWLRVPGSERFELKAAYAAEKQAPSRRTVGRHFELDKGPLGHAAAAKGAAALSPEQVRELGWEQGEVLAAPLHVGARALGLLVLRRKQAGFDDDDVRMIEALAGRVTVALQNSDLYEQSKALGRRLNAAIAALGEALAAALDMQELVQVVADKAAELACAYAAIIFLEDDAGNLTVRAVTATDGGAVADPGAYHGAAVMATQANGVICISGRDRRADDRLRSVMSGERVGSVCAFPLIVRGKAAGALCVLCQGRTMRAQERHLAASFAQQAAVGIENVILFDETQQRLGELADLSLASARISSTLDLIVIAQIIVESISRALHMPVAAIALLDSAGEFHIPEGGHRGLPASFVRRFAVRPDSIAFAVVADQRIKVISDIAAEGRAEDSLVRGLDLASLICAPLKGREGVLGVLFAADRVPRTLRPHEEALVSAYANEAALALQNAFHHQAVANHARELEGILDATKTIGSTLELQPVLDHLASAAASLLNAPVCNIMLLDPAGEVLHTAASCGLAADHQLNSDLHVGESIAGMVAMQGVAMTSTDLPRDGRFKHRAVARAEGLRSMLSVPLTVKGKPAGVITVYSPAPQPFTASQQRLLTTLAAEAAVAIENARLYSEAREQTSSMRQLMEEVNHRIKNNLQSIIGIIQLHIGQAEKDPGVTTVLREIMSRVQAIAVVHELLFDEDMRAVDVKETSRRILDNALRSAPDGKLKLSGQVTGARLRLPSRKATPLASIVNELVYNSVSHAFGGREHGQVAISFQEATGGQILVQVSDDGVGLPAGFDLARDAKLGLRIVEGLVTQDLGGEFSLSSNGGTIARIRFER